MGKDIQYNQWMPVDAVRADLSSLQESDEILHKAGIKDRNSCLALWDWCIPKIKDMLSMLETTEDFYESFYNRVECATSKCAIVVCKITKGNYFIYFEGVEFKFKKPLPEVMICGWGTDRLDKVLTLKAMVAFNKNFDEISDGFKSVVNKYRRCKIDTPPVETLDTYFQREFFQKGRKFNEVVSEMQDIGSDEAVLSVLKQALAEAVWQNKGLINGGQYNA